MDAFIRRRPREEEAGQESGFKNLQGFWEEKPKRFMPTPMGMLKSQAPPTPPEAFANHAPATKTKKPKSDPRLPKKSKSKSEQAFLTNDQKTAFYAWVRQLRLIGTGIISSDQYEAYAISNDLGANVTAKTLRTLVARNKDKIPGIAGPTIGPRIITVNGDKKLADLVNAHRGNPELKTVGLNYAALKRGISDTDPNITETQIRVRIKQGVLDGRKVLSGASAKKAGEVGAKVIANGGSKKQARDATLANMPSNNFMRINAELSDEAKKLKAAGKDREAQKVKESIKGPAGSNARLAREIREEADPEKALEMLKSAPGFAFKNMRLTLEAKALALDGRSGEAEKLLQLRSGAAGIYSRYHGEVQALKADGKHDKARELEKPMFGGAAANAKIHDEVQALRDAGEHKAARKKEEGYINSGENVKIRNEVQALRDDGQHEVARLLEEGYIGFAGENVKTHSKVQALKNASKPEAARQLQASYPGVTGESVTLKDKMEIQLVAGDVEEALNTKMLMRGDTQIVACLQLLALYIEQKREEPVSPMEWVERHFPGANKGNVALCFMYQCQANFLEDEGNYDEANHYYQRVLDLTPAGFGCMIRIFPCGSDHFGKGLIGYEYMAYLILIRGLHSSPVCDFFSTPHW